MYYYHVYNGINLNPEVEGPFTDSRDALIHMSEHHPGHPGQEITILKQVGESK